MIRRPPRSTLSSSSAASDVYKRQIKYCFVLILSYLCRRFSIKKLFDLTIKKSSMIMKIRKSILLLMLITSTFPLLAQQQINWTKGDIVVAGTSTIHDLSLIHI
eukprot:TRINITY_DN10385_c0_g1_i1.p2 TRINITY_DN10385_c0_g1~~TRINITY_DN10385_c0_g1_i1.p2  ORF type:complete len:104 (-),score=17.69 TRINITY_DN10385_c0_g1_i1:36-347(-)